MTVLDVARADRSLCSVSECHMTFVKLFQFHPVAVEA